MLLTSRIRRAAPSAGNLSVPVTARALSGSRARARGQALVLVLVSLVALVLGLIVVFDTGQVVTRKVQLVNTADAAAYSAAEQEARDLNLIAYMNRAIVANQIAVAQTASWYSWTNFAISATVHLKDFLQVSELAAAFVPGLGEAVQAMVEGLQTAQGMLQGMRTVEQRAFPLAAGLVAGLDKAYSDASLLVGRAGSLDAANLARSVVRLNDPQATLPAFAWARLGLDATEADGYVRRYQVAGAPSAPAGDRGGLRLRDVVMEARDPFSRSRNGSLLGVFKKQGGTDLVSQNAGIGYNSWVGADTLDFNISIPLLDNETPLGWGGAAVLDATTPASWSYAFVANHAGYWNAPYPGDPPNYANAGRYVRYGGALANGLATKAVYADPGEPWAARSPIATVGLPEYDDIVPNKATVPYVDGAAPAPPAAGAPDVGPIFTVLVAQPINTVHTSSHVNGIGGPPDFQTTDSTIRDGLTAVASAQVYFERSATLFPRLFDPQREIGSLFSPYWQARLVDTPCTVRQEIAVSYGAVAPCT